MPAAHAQATVYRHLRGGGSRPETRSSGKWSIWQRWCGCEVDSDIIPHDQGRKRGKRSGRIIHDLPCFRIAEIERQPKEGP